MTISKTSHNVKIEYLTLCIGAFTGNKSLTTDTGTECIPFMLEMDGNFPKNIEVELQGNFYGFYGVETKIEKIKLIDENIKDINKIAYGCISKKACLHGPCEDVQWVSDIDN